MSEEYLWDRSGHPDPEIQLLERILGRFGHRPALPSKSFRPSLWIGSAAAVMLIGCGIFFLIHRKPWGEPRPVSGYPVVPLAGEARIESAGGSRLADEALPGEVIETGEGGEARLVVGSIGEVFLQERSRMKVIDCGDASHRLHLERGAIRASIFAAPRIFQVGTPAAIAVDLGCVYRLTVDGSGITQLEVEIGRVSFEVRERTVVVPAGAVCRAFPDRGLGLPVRADAPARLREAVSAIERSASDDAALRSCLDVAGDRDTLTLWHLLPVVPPQKRGSVFDRMNELSPAPSGITREACVALDAASLDAWRRDLSSRW